MSKEPLNSNEIGQLVTFCHSYGEYNKDTIEFLINTINLLIDNTFVEQSEYDETFLGRVGYWIEYLSFLGDVPVLFKDTYDDFEMKRLNLCDERAPSYIN